MTRAQAMIQARRMRAAGWGPTFIRRALAREGVVVSDQTAKRWTDEEYAEKCRSGHRRRQAARRANAGRFTTHGDTPEYRLEFMRRLQAEGVSCSAIGKVCGVIFDESLTAHQVRYALRDVAA